MPFIKPLERHEKQILSDMVKELPVDAVDNDYFQKLLNGNNEFETYKLRVIAQVRSRNYLQHVRFYCAEALAYVRNYRQHYPSRPISIVLDVDQTILDISSRRLIQEFPQILKPSVRKEAERKYASFEPKANTLKLLWESWGIAKPIPPVIEFMKTLRRYGVRTYLITGRLDRKVIRKALASNLIALHLEAGRDYQKLMMKDPNLGVVNGKTKMHLAVRSDIQDEAYYKYIPFNPFEKYFPSHCLLKANSPVIDLKLKDILLAMGDHDTDFSGMGHAIKRIKLPDPFEKLPYNLINA